MRAWVLIGAAMAVLVGSVAATGSASAGGNGDPTSQSKRGMSFSGLVRATTGPCVGDFEVTVPGLAKKVCSHGPDAAPVGTDVTVAQDLIASSGTALDSVPVPCIGDGTTGPRVQAVYAVAADRSNQFATVAPQIAIWAGQMENAVDKSAQQTGGERHLRFVTNADCSLNVAQVLLSATGDDNFGNTISELRAAGLDRTDRKYIIWADALIYCGIGQLSGSDSADLSNPANGGPTYGRVDTGCWNRADHNSALHELMHSLGAVQPTAPHSTAAFHCTDESDAMCYSDAAGVTMTQVCPADNEWLLDCGNDDYFTTNPAPGSYLASHWNTANSRFLATSLTDSGSAPTPPPGPTPVATTTLDSFSGSVSARKPTVTFTVATGAGATTASLAFAANGKAKSAPTTRLRVLAPDGTVVAQASGPSVLSLAASVGSGNYRWEITGSSSVSFTLKVTHVVP